MSRSARGRTIARGEGVLALRKLLAILEYSPDLYDELLDDLDHAVAGQPQ
jgi:hypothetical protein